MSQTSPIDTVKVSVIIPVFNAAPYLERTFESLRKQTHSNIEIIIIDDGSTDESPQRCKDNTEIDNRIIVIHQENQGASIARNRGIETASGEYIMFMDADDEISPYALDSLLQTILLHNADIAIGDVEIIRGIKTISWSTPDISTSRQVNSIQAYNHLARYEWWGPVAKLYKASFLKQFRFPKETLSEDYFLMVQMFHQASICHQPGVIYAYHKRESSLSTATDLTPHSLDELHNTYNAWLYAKNHVPTFVNSALHFYSETSVKLATLSFFSNRQEAAQCWALSRMLLKKHTISILLNKKSHFALKLRVICIVLGKITMPIIKHFIHHS